GGRPVTRPRGVGVFAPRARRLRREPLGGRATPPHAPAKPSAEALARSPAVVSLLMAPQTVRPCARFALPAPQKPSRLQDTAAPRTALGSRRASCSCAYKRPRAVVDKSASRARVGLTSTKSGGVSRNESNTHHSIAPRKAA